MTAGTPYAAVIDAVCAQLPRLRRRDLGLVCAHWHSEPPHEDVGLEPFAPRSTSGCPRERRHRGEGLLLGRGAYFALGVLVIGHIWRWRYDQYGWISRSTQLQERRMLKWGGPLFHYATFAAIAGDVLGILIPAAFTEFLGIPDHV